MTTSTTHVAEERPAIAQPKPSRPLGTATMQAAVLAGPREICFRQVPLPEPGPGQVRVRLEGCGVCASNVPVWEGRPWFTYPGAPGEPGHEGWGVVDRVGKNVASVQVGDRVAMLSHHAYAEFDLAEAAFVVKLPAKLVGTPVPGEPLGCAVNIARRSEILPGQTVAVVGIGFLGTLLVQLAVQAGASVVAISRRRSALELARRFGAQEILLFEDRRQAVAAAEALTNGVGFDRVIEATGHQEPLDLAGDITCTRGRLVIAGYHQDGSRQVNMQQWNWRGLDVINAHERDPRIYVKGIRRAVEQLAAGRLNPNPMYTHVYPFDRLSEAMATTATRPDSFVKALILMATADR